jgi:NADH-ubiquinone/plastoquinone oxidoreductase chain 6.
LEVALLLGVLLALASIIVALLTVTLRDLVYSSSLLAVLGSLVAAFLALLGYYIVAAFIVIVYVGAAVMFIVLTVSMLGGGGAEVRNNLRGALVASVTLVVLAVALLVLGIPSHVFPVNVDVRVVSDSLLSDYALVLAVLLVALAATVIEGIAVARRG